MTKKPVEIVQKKNYKISEKIYSLLKRFVIFASQNKKIAEYFLQQFNKKPEKEDGRNAVKYKTVKGLSKDDAKQLTGSDFTDIKDDTFKVLLLRNLIFHMRFKPPEVNELGQFLLEKIQQTFRQLKFNWNVLVKIQDQYLNKEREKSVLNNIFN